MVGKVKCGGIGERLKCSKSVVSCTTAQVRSSDGWRCGLEIVGMGVVLSGQARVLLMLMIRPHMRRLRLENGNFNFLNCDLPSGVLLDPSHSLRSTSVEFSLVR